MVFSLLLALSVLFGSAAFSLGLGFWCRCSGRWPQPPCYIDRRDMRGSVGPLFPVHRPYWSSSSSSKKFDERGHCEAAQRIKPFARSASCSPFTICCPYSHTMGFDEQGLCEANVVNESFAHLCHRMGPVWAVIQIRRQIGRGEEGRGEPYM